MRGFKEPGFQERVASANKARDKALKALKEKPPIDEAEQARRIARQEAKRAAAAEKREAARLARLAEKEAKAESEREAAAAIEAEPTEAEKKAARDAKYAARKKRKRR